MNKAVKNKKSSDPDLIPTNNTNNDEIWEIIDLDDDGNNTLIALQKKKKCI